METMLCPEFLKDFQTELSRQVALHRNVIDKIQSEKLGFKRAGVLVALFELDNEVFVILTKRSENLRIHKGHVSLPGGKCDDTDVDVIDTALRETEEEIGLHRSNVTILGTGFPSMSIHGISITPVVAVVKDIKKVNLNINRSEVDVAFACPLKLFLDQTKHTWNNIHSFVYHVPVYNYDSDNSCLLELLKKREGQKFRVWGVTAHILVPLVCLFYQQSVTLPPCTYNYKDVFLQTIKYFETSPHFKAVFEHISKL